MYRIDRIVVVVAKEMESWNWVPRCIRRKNNLRACVLVEATNLKKH
jgi:hypothetical protein